MTEAEQLAYYCKFNPEQAVCRAPAAGGGTFATGQPGGSGAGSPSFIPAGYASASDPYPEITELNIELARISAAVAQRPRDRKLRALKSRTEARIKRLKRRLGLSGFAGLEGLSDSEPISKIIGSVGDSIVKVTDAIKGKPKTPPPDGGRQPSGGSEFPWKTVAITAGVAIGGFFLWKKLGRKGR